MPHLIDGSRRKRIARGSGITIQQVNQLLQARKQMEKMMKQMGSARAGSCLGACPAGKPRRAHGKSKQTKKARR